MIHTDYVTIIMIVIGFMKGTKGVLGNKKRLLKNSL